MYEGPKKADMQEELALRSPLTLRESQIISTRRAKDTNVELVSLYTKFFHQTTVPFKLYNCKIICIT